MQIKKTKRPLDSQLEFPKGHPIHEVPLHGKDQFGHTPEERQMGTTAYLKKRSKKEKPAWALKHRKTKKVDYWYIDYHSGLVFVILGTVLTPLMQGYWLATVNMLNSCHAIASADLSVYGIE
jgi:hypothetical protein